MQDWSKYIERPIVEVLPEMEAEGYRVASDECAIFGFRNIDIENGDVAAENSRYRISRRRRTGTTSMMSRTSVSVDSRTVAWANSKAGAVTSSCRNAIPTTTSAMPRERR